MGWRGGVTDLLPARPAEELVARPDAENAPHGEVGVDYGRSVEGVEAHRVQPARGRAARSFRVACLSSQSVFFFFPCRAYLRSFFFSRIASKTHRFAYQ